jgi:hypothetical protein
LGLVFLFLSSVFRMPAPSVPSWLTAPTTPFGGTAPLPAFPLLAKHHPRFNVLAEAAVPYLPSSVLQPLLQIGGARSKWDVAQIGDYLSGLGRAREQAAGQEKFSADPIIAPTPPPTPRFSPGVEPAVGLSQEQGFYDSFTPQPTGPGLVESSLRALGPVGTQIYSQLPRIRLADSVLGGVSGAGLGLAMQGIRNQFRDDESRKREGSGYGQAAAVGGALGVLGGNVIGDRARRYLSNTLTPMAYQGDLWDRIRPRGVDHVYHAAILDEPQFQTGKDDWASGTIGQHQKLTEAGKDQIGARHELVRRQFGVHTDDPKADYWAANPDGSYSLNPGHPRIGSLLDMLTGPPTLQRALVEDPKWITGSVNAYGTSTPKDLLMQRIVSGQMVKTTNLPDDRTLHTVKDRWDYTLDPGETGNLRQSLRDLAGRALQPGGVREWWDAPLQKTLDAAYTTPSTPGQTQGRTLTQLLGRLGLNTFVVDRDPWVHQHLLTEPVPGGTAVVPLTGEGRRYPIPPSVIPSK